MTGENCSFNIRIMNSFQSISTLYSRSSSTIYMDIYWNKKKPFPTNVKFEIRVASTLKTMSTESNHL